MTITQDEHGLSIGKNIVETLCLTLEKAKSYGWIEVNRKRYNWLATIDCVAAEKALRSAAESEGKRVTAIQYQNTN